MGINGGRDDGADHCFDDDHGNRLERDVFFNECGTVT
jgi:hypothetical protein